MAHAFQVKMRIVESNKYLRQTSGHAMFHEPTTIILKKCGAIVCPSVCRLMMNYYVQVMWEADGTLFIKQTSGCGVGIKYNVTVI